MGGFSCLLPLLCSLQLFKVSLTRIAVRVILRLRVSFQRFINQPFHKQLVVTDGFAYICQKFFKVVGHLCHSVPLCLQCFQIAFSILGRHAATAG